MKQARPGLDGNEFLYIKQLHVIGSLYMHRLVQIESTW